MNEDRTKTIPRQALILAGGRGIRLGALTEANPKPMLPVAGRPFLEHLLANLGKVGIERVILSVGHLAGLVEEYFACHDYPGLAVLCHREQRPLGTGGGVRHALGLLDETFFIVNGDTIFDCDLPDLASLMKPGVLAALALRRVDDASRYGRVRLDGERIRDFAEKTASGPGWISGGVYVLTRRAVTLLPEGESSLERDLFPLLAARGELAGRGYDGFFLDIGLPGTLALAQSAVAEWTRARRA